MNNALNEALQDQEQDHKTEPTAHHAMRRVLIVDDDLDTAEAIKFLVERHGNAICEVAVDPYEALVALSDHNFDVVFVDQKLPGLEGAKVLSKMDEYVDQDPLIVESGRYTHLVPAVLMSGSDVHLDANYHLRHFDLLKVINKKNLVNYLSQQFADQSA